MFNFQKATEYDFSTIQAFYWSVIDNIHQNNIKHENLGWEKGVYPSDDFIRDSLRSGELYVLTSGSVLYACVILNSSCNEGYDGCAWSIACSPGEVLTPHALAVNPEFQGKGIGQVVMENMIELAKSGHKRAIRLDVLGACRPAEHLYRSCGFHFVEAKNMYYEDTGWTEYKLFELNL